MRESTVTATPSPRSPLLSSPPPQKKRDLQEDKVFSAQETLEGGNKSDEKSAYRVACSGDAPFSSQWCPKKETFEAFELKFCTLRAWLCIARVGLPCLLRWSPSPTGRSAVASGLALFWTLNVDYSSTNLRITQLKPSAQVERTEFSSRKISENFCDDGFSRHTNWILF